MNGGRLSNDETFLLGVAELRAELTAAAPSPEISERAWARIALRYPEEAEALARRWQVAPDAGLLAEVEALHLADSED